MIDKYMQFLRAFLMAGQQQLAKFLVRPAKHSNVYTKKLITRKHRKVLRCIAKESRRRNRRLA